MKKLLTLSVLLFISLIAIFFVQCNEPVIEPNDQEMVLSLNKGEEEPTAGNNLSFPAFLADGYGITPIASTEFTFNKAYAGLYDGLSFGEIDWLNKNGENGGPNWYAQKEEGNIWQAGFIDYLDSKEENGAAFIDWGDNIESVNPKKDRPFRLEVTLYKNAAADDLDGYTMAVLANPSSKDEIQGTNGTTYKGIWATVASNNAKIVVQKYNAGSTLTWNGDNGKWDNAGDPDVSFGFAVELNVGGKLIYGASQGGWRPILAGNYRITFYLQGSNVNLGGAQIGNYVNGEVSSSTARLCQPVVEEVDSDEKDENGNKIKMTLTYVDVTVVEAGGGNTK